MELCIISGDGASNIPVRYAKAFKVPNVYIGRMDKLDALQEAVTELGISLAETVYMGDDVMDLPAMAAAAIGATVPTAHPHVLEHADWVSTQPAGAGAVRELSTSSSASKATPSPISGQHSTPPPDVVLTRVLSVVFRRLPPRGRAVGSFSAGTDLREPGAIDIVQSSMGFTGASFWGEGVLDGNFRVSGSASHRVETVFGPTSGYGQINPIQMANTYIAYDTRFGLYSGQNSDTGQGEHSIGVWNNRFHALSTGQAWRTGTAPARAPMTGATGGTTSATSSATPSRRRHRAVPTAGGHPPGDRHVSRRQGRLSPDGPAGVVAAKMSR